MKKGTTFIIILAVVFLAGLLSGCSIEQVESLYSLPQRADEYLQLQEQINQELLSGSEYSAPAFGSYRQSVQLYDLDGDGTDEALAFFRSSGGQALKICIYKYSDSGYSLATTIEGEGTAIGSVEFADFDGDGVSELVAVWQMSADLCLLKVYSLKGFNSAVLLTSDCTDFQVSDLSGDKVSRLLVLRFDPAQGGSVDMYSFPGEGEPEMSSAKLSAGLETVDRFRVGALKSGENAVFIEGEYDSGEKLITDVLARVDGQLKNISLDGDTGISKTQRDYKVYSGRFDGDRAMRVPVSNQLYVQEGYGSYQSFDWYGFDIHGNMTRDLSTYHCYSDGWFLVLPDSWRENLTLRREVSVSGERVVMLSRHDPDTDQVEDFLSVYTLTGDNRRDRAKLGSRFILLEDETTVYAARILKSRAEWEDALSQEELIERFRIIYSEWMTGAL